MFDLNKYMYSTESVESYKETEFTQKQQVIIVAMSGKCSLEEKIQDLRKMIDGGMDEAVRRDTEILIRLWNSILGDRYNHTGVIFFANLQEYGVESDRLSAYRFFSSYDRALEFLQNEKCCLKDTDTFGEIWRMEVDTDDPECDIYYFDNDLKLFNVVYCSSRAETENMKLFRYMQYVPNTDKDYSIKTELEKMNYK